METVIITGGTGLIGTALTQLLLERGYKVIILSRRPEAGSNKAVTYAHWNIDTQTIDKEAVQQADYIVHLAGANVGEKRWTAARKEEIIDSRTKSSGLIFTALQSIPNKVKKVISASATGYYGEFKDHPFTETDPPYTDFLATTTHTWEQSISKVTTLNKKLVIFRTGIVLSREGGAYHEFSKPFQFGVSGILGSGKQVVSWIHIDDMVGLILHALDAKRIDGVYNAVADTPVSNRKLIETMREVKKRVTLPVRVPALALRLGLGEMSVEVLKSATVSNRKWLETGFPLRFPAIRPAVEALERRS